MLCSTGLWISASTRQKKEPGRRRNGVSKWMGQQVMEGLVGAQVVVHDRCQLTGGVVITQNQRTRCEAWAKKIIWDVDVGLMFF